MKGEAAEVERQLAEAEECDPRRGERALSVFDFSQNLAKLWNGSNFGAKRDNPRSGEFEPYPLARKSLPDKEKALRLFGRRAHFEGWSGRLAEL